MRASRTVFQGLALGATILVVALAAAAPAKAAKKSEFRVCWATFAGYMPWGYANESGIMKKWGDKYGISVELVHYPEYVYSITAYANGEYDACAMTNIDALVSPAGAGIDTTAVLPLDFSNGADAIVMKGEGDVKDLAGQPVYLVQYSVSHYLLNRALEKVGLSEADVVIIDTSDKEIVRKYENPQVKNVVSWNPMLPTLLKQPGARKVFDTSSLPGEIIDIMAVNTETLVDNPQLGEALAGAWFEVMTIMSKDDDEGRTARIAMAVKSETDLAGFDEQLNSLRLFSTPHETVEFLESDALPKVMDSVRKFLFNHQLLGPQIASEDAVGISFPNGKVIGSKENVRLRFDSRFARSAMEGAPLAGAPDGGR